jgi:hypothetical protein
VHAEVRRHVEIHRGDTWEFVSNNGLIERSVKSIACGVVSYTRADGKLVQCSLSSFKKWTKGAQLSFAEDWSGRDYSGVVSTTLDVMEN